MKAPIHTVFCLASYFKGNDFLRECKELGHRVYLFTRQSKIDDDWAREAIDGIIPVADDGLISSYLHAATEAARMVKPTRIVALEEGDVITAGRLREHFCVPGMFSSQARLFRDKLAMRATAERHAITQAPFVNALNYQEIGEFMEGIGGPWVLKPRADASSIGIKKFSESEPVWRAVERLNRNEDPKERADAYLLEKFVPGDVYHVDSLVSGGKVAVACANRYGSAPLEIAVNGGVSSSYTLEYDSEERKQLLKANRKVLKAFGLKNGATHAEFIKSRRDGDFYFLEVGARIGGAYTAEAFEAACGLNIWREWAKIETAPDGESYSPKATRKEFGGIVVSLARQQFPDTSEYVDPEIVVRPHREHHVGLVLRSDDQLRLRFLLEEYTRRFTFDFMSVAPQPDRPE
jgi:glutathione synthase/RimK-type ligase-like ATP-grasp enzyme